MGPHFGGPERALETGRQGSARSAPAFPGSFGNERLEIVFEEQQEYQTYTELALSAIVSLKDQRPAWFLTDDRQPKLAKWSFVPKDSTIFTQPADYFVYALRQLYQNRHSKKAEWCRPILKSSNGEGFGAAMTRKQIRQSMIYLPFMAMRAQALRQSGKLPGLDLEPAQMTALIEKLSRLGQKSDE